MKFMKLGSRHDAFCTIGAARSILPDVSSDLTVEVNGTRYLLHKFPLFSKCLRLHKPCSDSPETSEQHTFHLPDFPGGLEAFELCTKFCYGYTITLSAYNIVSARCAAEYLQMTEEVDKGNLISKLETFLTCCILQGWKDAIVTLQSTKALQAWSEDLEITGRCIDAIASKVRANPEKMNLSRCYSIRGGGRYEGITCNGSESQRHKTWWAEDLADLSIDLYWRTMIAIKSGGRVPPNVMGDALAIYVSRWLPDLPSFDKIKKDLDSSKYRLVLESIVSLLPAEKGAVSCSFLLKLLKAANFLGASTSSKVELARRVAVRLEDASVGELLIPSASPTTDTKYDVDTVMIILEEFMLQGQSPPTSPLRKSKRDFERRRSRSAEIDFQESSRRSSSSASHSSKLKVAKLFDCYLQEISHDPNLAPSKFIAIAESIPDFARPDHDDLYKAIDIYLKRHPELNKSERKRICSSLDCKKLSMEACMHAAQNELLPLRVLVQVLFIEQARAAMSNGHVVELPSNLKALISNAGHGDRIAKSKFSPPDHLWAASGLTIPKVTLKMKLAEEDDDDMDRIFADGLRKSSRCFKFF